MTIPLLLLAVLEQHSGCQDQSNIYTDDTKCSREDGIKECVGERNERGHTTDICGGCEGIWAGGVRNEEGWRGGVVVTAAVELF
jgi:hypothetical protein